MNRIEDIEHQIECLSAEELRELRAWFVKYDAEDWDRQFEADVSSGKLDRLAQSALADYEAGRSTEL